MLDNANVGSWHATAENAPSARGSNTSESDRRCGWRENRQKSGVQLPCLVGPSSTVGDPIQTFDLATGSQVCHNSLRIIEGDMAGTISHWLRTIGLDEYTELFIENKVDLDAIRDLDQDDLRELGIPMGPRKKLLRAITALQDSSVDAALDVSIPAPIRTAIAPERRQVSVLFCDLVGSTALSGRLDPEDMRDVMRHYQDTVAAAVAQSDGYVANYLGDGVVVYFGWPRAREDQAERAVRGGLATLAALAVRPASGNEQLQARIGIATGAVVVGDLTGEASHQTDAVSGQAPNLAARLQALAEPGEIAIDTATRHLLGASFELDDIGTHNLKGMDNPIPAWRVRGEAIIESRFDATHTGHLANLIGREEELALLTSRWTRAAAGDGQVVLLSGEAGIGKSRIVRSLREHLSDARVTPLRYQCSPHFTNSALYPVIGQLERAAGFERGDTVDEKFAKLEAVLAETDRPKDQTASLLGALLSLPIEDRYPPLNMSPQRQLEDILATLVEQAAAFSEKAPALIVMEDLHWADPTTLDLLGRIIVISAGKPILLILTFRPHFEPPWPGHAHVTTLTLNRLGISQCAAIVGHQTGGKPLPDELSRQIIDKTDGVPLFVEELTKNVLEAGLVRDIGEAYELTGPLPNLAIPSTLQDSLMARLDRLSPVKEVAQIGSCIGREFSHEMLTAVSGRGDNELTDALRQLVNAELIFPRGSPPNSTYQFKHALVRDAAYESLLKGRRHQVHGQIVAALEIQQPAIRQTSPETFAHHYQQAGRFEEAAQLWLVAGMTAMAKSMNAEAIGHLQNGLASNENVELERIRLESEVDFLIALALAHNGQFGYGDTRGRDILSNALELCDRLESNAKKPFILAIFGVYPWMWNDLNRSIQYENEAVKIAESTGSLVDLIVAKDTAGAVSVQMGELERGKLLLKEALTLYDNCDHSEITNLTNLEQGAFSACFLALAQLYEGDYVGSNGTIQIAEDLALDSNHFLSQTMVYFFKSWLAVLVEDYNRAEKWAKKSIEICDAQAIPFWKGYAEASYGYALGRLGNIEKGLEHIQMCITFRQMMGTINLIGLFSLWHVTLLLNERRQDEIDGLLEKTEPLIRNSGDATELLNWKHMSAKVLCARGNSAEAVQYYEQMLELASSKKMVWFELRAMRELAPLLAEQGKATEAVRRMDDILGRLAAPGSNPAILEAQEIRNSMGLFA